MKHRTNGSTIAVLTHGTAARCYGSLEELQRRTAPWRRVILPSTWRGIEQSTRVAIALRSLDASYLRLPAILSTPGA